MLYAVALLAFLFSPFILNDVLVLILTLTMIRYAKQYAVDEAPLVVAEVTAANVASSLTSLAARKAYSCGPHGACGLRRLRPWGVPLRRCLGCHRFPSHRPTRQEGWGPEGERSAGREPLPA